MPYTPFINLREENLFIKFPKEIIKGDTIRAGTEVSIGYKRYLSHTVTLALNESPNLNSSPVILILGKTLCFKKLGKIRIIPSVGI